MAQREHRIDLSPQPSVGPAPVAHQVRQLTVQIESIDGVGLRFSTPTARGWAVVARNQAEVGRAIQAAFTEAQVAAYAKAHGIAYDLDAMTAAVPGDPMAPPIQRPRRRPASDGVGWRKGQRRPDVHDPADWSLLESGDLRSPGGKTVRADSPMGVRILQLRKQLGLPH
jgi:hypothetical protein